MIISDLEHLEVVAEASNIVGGTKKKQPKVNLIVIKFEAPKPVALPVNEASADADATALGKNTETVTNTNAEVVQGVGSTSNSNSFAKAS